MPNPQPLPTIADILADIGQALDDARETFGDATGKPTDFKGLTYDGAIREMTRLHAETKAYCEQVREWMKRDATTIFSMARENAELKAAHDECRTHPADHVSPTFEEFFFGA